MFEINLQIKKELSTNIIILDKKTYDSDMDDETSIIFDICEIFENTKNIEFNISGFGQNNWPVSCKFDLPGIIEELPEIINNFYNDDFNFILNFYEQGIEREIIFEDNNDNIKIICLSNTNWKPNPKCIFMRKKEVKNLIENLYKNFVLYSNKICPDLINHSLIKDWLNTITL